MGSSVFQLNDDLPDIRFTNLGQWGQVLVSWPFQILVDTQIQILITGVQPLWHRENVAFLVPATVRVSVGIESLFVWHHLFNSYEYTFDVCVVVSK